MRNKIVMLLIIVCFFAVGITISEAKGLDVYKFKKERVDQDLTGNRGYLMGQSEDMTEKDRSSQRTLIGVDIELPALLPEKDTEEEEIVEEEAPAQEEAPVEVIEEKKVYEEEEWIK